MQIILLFFFFHVLHSEQSGEKHDNFFLLEDKNYDDFILNWDLNFIYLHTKKDCHFCNIAYKTLDQLAHKYNDPYSTRNRFALVDCETSPSVCQKISN